MFPTFCPSIFLTNRMTVEGSTKNRNSCGTHDFDFCYCIAYTFGQVVEMPSGHYDNIFGMK